MSAEAKLQFVSWPSIEQLHSVVRNAAVEAKNAASPRLRHLERPVVYRGKVKLHGQNAAVTLQRGGVGLQSRNCFVERDNKMGALLASFEPFLQPLLGSPLAAAAGGSLTVFGEYCGPGVQGGSIALNKVKHNFFAVFSIMAGDKLVVDPAHIERFLTDGGKRALPEKMHVVPWETDTFELHLLDEAQMAAPVDKLNALVDAIDREDPWVRRTFDAVGNGEGLVLYPVSLLDGELLSVEHFAFFCFKAKGEAHRNVVSKKSAQLRAEKAAGAEDFARIMVTPQRCEQGLQMTGELVNANIRKFIQWVVADVEKEGQAELEASGLTWEVASKEVTARAREWYLAKLRRP